MIRILHVVTIMDKGGLESRLMDIYRFIDREKVQFDFYTNRKEEGYFEKEIKYMGGLIFHSEPYQPLKMKSKEKEFQSFLREHTEYNIIHIHLNELSYVFCKAAKKVGVPVRIVHSRGANRDHSLKGAYKNILKRGIPNTATHLFAVSMMAGIHLFGSGAMTKRGEVWPNAIDCKMFSYNLIKREKLRTEFNVNNDFVVMHVGNFTPAKNHPFIIEVFSEINRLIPESKLILVGGGNHVEKVQKLVEEKGLSAAVYFLGIRNNINELLQMADVFLFPSLHEGFPGAVLEAQAAGLPCVISSSITTEVVLVDTCIQLELSLPINFWAMQVIQFRGTQRSDTYQTLLDKGYDVQSVAQKYEQFYLSVI